MYIINASKIKPKSISECQTSSSSSNSSPVVRAVLRRPAPLRLVAVLGVASRLGLATTRLYMAAGHIATGWLWVRAAVVAASTGGKRWVGFVLVSRWRAGSSVRNHYSGSLTVAKSDCGSLRGVRSRAGARARARSRLRRHASVDGFGNSNIGSARGAVGGLRDIDSGSGRASAFHNHRSVLSRR